MTDDEVMEALTRAAIQLLTRDPFLGHIFGGLSRSVGEGRWPLVTEVTPRGFRVVVSRSAFMALTHRQRRVALEHELLHLVFRHCDRSFAYRNDAARFALACDLVVNQLLSQGMPLEDMVCLHHFSPPLPRDLTAEAYYAMLLRPPCASGPARCSGSMPKWGACCVASSGENEGDVPNPWAGQGSPASRQVAHAQLDRLVYRAMLKVGSKKCIGRFPGHIAEHLAGLIREIEGVLDWRSALRRFASSSRKSRIKNTMRRRSKRYGSFPGIKLLRKHRVAVCVDTSGSISEDDLRRFFAEIEQIHRAGADIEIIEADVSVQRRYVYQGRPPSEVHGRGGTSFDQALKAVRETSARFDACVYLTDGFAHQPVEPPRCPLIWILSTEATIDTEHLRFGRVVRMQPTD